MGNTDSKFSDIYKDHLYQLSENDIPLFNGHNDNTEFNHFYLDFINIAANLSVDSLNSLVTNNILRKIIGLNFNNYSNLLIFTIKYSINLIDDLDNDFETVDNTSSIIRLSFNNIITSVRILTKLIPIYFEFTTEKKFDQLILIENLSILSNYLLKLCFIEGLTIPVVLHPGKFNLTLWEIGISNSNETKRPIQLPVLDSNRLEILNLFLTLSSLNLYSKEIKNKNFFIDCLINENESFLLFLLISILNQFANYSIHFKEQQTHPYKLSSNKQSSSQRHSLLKLKNNLILTSLQWFNLIVLNLNDNSFFLQTFLKNEYHLKLLLSSIVKIFKYPIDLAIDQESNPLNFNNNKDNDLNHENNTGSGTNLSSNNIHKNNLSQDNQDSDVTSSSSAPAFQLPKLQPIFLQSLILLTNLLKFNKTFENYFADKFANKFLVFVIYYIKFYHNIPEYRSNIIPLCCSLSLSLTTKPLILYKLLQTFTTNYYTNELPNFFKISNISQIDSLTYRDFILIQLSNMSINDIKRNHILRPHLFELIYNILPINANITSNEINNYNYNASSSDINLVQLSSLKKCNPSVTDKLSYSATIALLNLLSKLSNKNYLSSFASSNSTQQIPLTSPVLKLDLLALLIRSILVYITLCYQESKNLIFLLTRHYTILLQIKESINFISKNKNLSDMLFLDNLPTHLLSVMDQASSSANSTIMDNNSNDSSNDLELTISSNHEDNMHDEIGQAMLENDTYLFFDKPLKDYSDDDTENEEDSEIAQHSKTFNHVNKHTAKFMTSKDSVNVNTVNNKEYEIYEHPDYNKQLIVNNKKLFTELRPKWPIGLTVNTKLKSSKKLDFNDLWTGKSTLNSLIDITKIFLKEYPNIIKTKKNSDYLSIIKEIDEFEPSFEKRFKASKAINFYSNKPLEFRLSKKGNIVFNNWLYEIFWSNVFQSHSTAYVKPSSTILDDSKTINISSYSKTDSSVSSSPNVPVLERWSSQGSTLSRTYSNSSSIISSFTQERNGDQSSGYTPVTTANSASSAIAVPNNNSNNNYNLSRKNSNVSSFLSRFSWTGFNKNDNQEGAIQEEPVDELTTYLRNFAIDEGLVKSNIWVGTHIKLFPITTVEKEEFSFLDMTSSLLKKFRFNNNDNNDGDQNINNSNSNSNDDKRHYSPTLSANPFMAFATTKRYY